jgi:hypothetical protein
VPVKFNDPIHLYINGDQSVCPDAWSSDILVYELQEPTQRLERHSAHVVQQQCKLQ